MSIRIVVTGGRDFADEDFVDATLDRIHAERDISFLAQGGNSTWCKKTKQHIGADLFAKNWAENNYIRCRTWHADWQPGNVKGDPAGPIRNGRMLVEAKPNLVIAFPGGRGTADCVRQARTRGIEVLEVKP